MASSRPGVDARADAGFATPAAVVVSLAVATLALAVESRAILAVHTAEADYAERSTEIRLDGAERLALAALTSEGLPRPAGVITLGTRPMSVVAEPEAAKLSLEAAAALPPDQLQALGARDPAAVARGLQRLAASSGVTPDDIVALDPSWRWRACAKRWISPYGGASEAAASLAFTRALARPGDIWRIVVVDTSGWAEDRTLRIVGAPDQPGRTIDRSLYRRPPGEGPCRLATASPPPSPARPATP